MIPVRNMLIGGIIKVIINYFLVGNPEINIIGAPIGTNVCYIVIAVLNLIEVRKITKAEYKIRDFLIKPILAVASLGIAAVFTYNKLIFYVQRNNITTIASIVAGGIIYALTLIAIGAIKKEDVEMMPKGDRLLKLFNSFGLLK